MKRFVLRACLMALIPLAFVAGWSAFVFQGEKALYEKGLSLPAGTRHVVIGDSESAYAFDPAKTPGLVNLSAQGMTLDQYLYKFRDLVRLNADRTADLTVHVAISPLRFYSPLTPMSARAFEGRYVFLNLLHTRDAVRALAAPWLLWRDRGLFARTHVLTRRLRGKTKKPVVSEAVGAYTPWELCGFTADPVRARTKSTAYAEAIERARTASCDGADGERALDTLLREASACGVKVSLMTLPYHAAVRDRLDPSTERVFRARLERIAARHGATYVDAFRMPLPDEAYLDGTHVNTKGGALLSARFFPKGDGL